ncbi:DUF1987 domain-containing protein [Hugenholtzia roseola]|uniref:DUF1987 domain-containing protein n=1 Tax=Hugenholtzia roseola TaxID=1002 RepID=UPI00040250D5|nr:DUF1987 domain-containing protein [Hugenholtzia roseola]
MSLKNLYIEGRKYIPSVKFELENNHLFFAGQCYHEYTEEFFAPIYEWVRDYLATEPSQPITLEFRMDYYNTVCSRCFLEFFEMFENYQTDGGQVQVLWYYRQDDTDMLENGEDFKDDIDLPFTFLAY